jgi:hypothetical protein
MKYTAAAAPNPARIQAIVSPVTTVAAASLPQPVSQRSRSDTARRTARSANDGLPR